MDDEWWEEGACPDVTVYEPDEQEEASVIYDHEGNPFMRKKFKMGFDLDVQNARQGIKLTHAARRMYFWYAELQRG